MQRLVIVQAAIKAGHGLLAQDRSNDNRILISGNSARFHIRSGKTSAPNDFIGLGVARGIHDKAGMACAYSTEN